MNQYPYYCRYPQEAYCWSLLETQDGITLKAKCKMCEFNAENIKIKDYRIKFIAYLKLTLNNILNKFKEDK